jgi:hypothetical protein
MLTLLDNDLEAAMPEPYHLMEADDPKPAACGRNRCGSCSASSPAITATVAGVGENDLRKLCPRPVRLTVSARTQLRLTRGSPGGAGLTETLMPLELCEFCCAGATCLSGAGLRSRSPKARATMLRHRRCGRARSVAHREHFGPGLEAARDVPKGTTRPGGDPQLFRHRKCGVLRHVAMANV